MASARDRLFTSRFFVACGFSATVFISAFALFPTGPIRILELGGSTTAAGWFLGGLTYASALTAPFTGGLSDRFGRRRTLVWCSLAILGVSLAYSFTRHPASMVALAFVHGVFWSGLLSASAAYVADIVPATRRAEGLAYWGLSTILAIAVGPPLGLWLNDRSWVALCLTVAALNLAMSAIALALEETAHAHSGHQGGRRGPLIEWRVLVVAGTLFLCSFGYGGIASFIAIFSESIGVQPPGLYFTVLAGVMVVTRPVLGPIADRRGHMRVLLPCLLLVTAGFALLARAQSTTELVISAVVFGAGFGSAYPVLTAFVLQHVEASRRGAAFGSLLAAFDTGIGSGSIALGWIIDHYGYTYAFGCATLVSVLAAPYLLATRSLVAGRSTP